MADYTAVLEDLKKLFGTGTSVSAGSRDGGGTIWSTYYDGCEQDKTEIHETEDTVNDHLDEEGAMDYVGKRKGAAVTDYSSFLAAWNGSSGFRVDCELIAEMDNLQDWWRDDVHKPIHNDSFTARKSKVLESWYGPGAQSYATVLEKQTAAMDEFVKMVELAQSSIKTINDTVKGIAVASKNYGNSLNEAIGGVKAPDEHERIYFGVRADMGATNFAGLSEWIANLKSSGNWTDTMATLTTTMEDALVRSPVFGEDKWPPAKVDGLNDMQNGNGGLGDQQNKQQPPSTEAPKDTAPTGDDGTPVDTGDVDTYGQGDRDGEESPET